MHQHWNILKIFKDFFFGSLASDLFASRAIVAAKYILGRIKESLVCQPNVYSDRIIFANATTTDQTIKKSNQSLFYKTNEWDIKGPFDILNNIS